MKMISPMLFLLALFIGCQKMQLAEYKKFDSDAEVPRISIADAKKDFDAGNAVIVDARGESAWKQEHIAGSITLPAGGDDQFASLPKNKKIIVYCS